MDKILMYLVAFVFLALALNGLVFAASPALVKGKKLPAISLPIPKNSDEKIYLGLSGEGSFKISQIKAKRVLIKIFNLYCPICQSTATVMGELYLQIEHHPNLKDKMKLIGIGVGNNLLEIEVFKQNHNIPFPIFPDENFKIHQALGETRIPFYIAIKMDRDGSNEIVHTHLGGLTDVRGLFNKLVEVYGMKQEGLLIKEEANSLKCFECHTNILKRHSLAEAKKTCVQCHETRCGSSYQ